MHHIFPGRDDECAPEMPADVDPATMVNAEGIQTIEEQPRDLASVERPPRKARDGTKSKKG
jgi:hypothetical protein